ncbi:MAG TPA: hypothetical protein VGV16_08695 [Gammaproteobacteria bacterium]|nr:hypothetical protein [Gammaproteobacteria bacterium]
MKLVNAVRLTGALVAGVVLSLFAGTASAAPVGTPTGTTISNLATVAYSVNGVSQASIGSSAAGNTSGAGTATTFVVDTKLSLVVTTVDSSEVLVAAGQTGAVLVYQVTNNGNSTQGINFSTVQEATNTLDPFNAALKDDFDPTSPTVWVSSSNVNTYNSATDTSHSLFSLASGSSNYVFIVSTVPAGQVNGDIAVEALVAQEAATGANYAAGAGASITTDQSGSAWTPGTAQQIFYDTAGGAGDGDAANDGKASSRDAYLVRVAALTITKGTPVVLSDPTGDAIKHAIPGAVMQYTVTIANAATARLNASSITLTDALPANTSWGTSGAGTMTVATPGVNSGNPLSCPDGSVTTGTVTGGVPYTADSCDFNKTTANTITVSGITLKPGDTTTIVYTVTIN